MTQKVIVLYSGGKDSAVTLDLCCRFFAHVTVYFMFIVAGLSFQTAVLNWAKNRYALEIRSLPHFMLSDLLRYGTYREPDLSVPIVSPGDYYRYMRVKSGCWWIAGGERINDSVWRRAMIKRTGSIDESRGRFYPAAYWSKSDVENYIRIKKLKVTPEAAVLGHSFRSLLPAELHAVKKYYPNDYRKIQRWFPLCEAAVKHHEWHTDQISEI